MLVMMRAQQAVAVGDSMGYLTAEHYQQIFTAHGVTMIFFVGMGVMFGIINLVLPLQIGARDVAFPFLNNLSFWLFAFWRDVHPRLFGDRLLCRNRMVGLSTSCRIKI